MLIRKKPNRPHAPGEPLLHENHKRPVTRREMMAAGLLSGPAMVYAPAWLGALLRTGRADATLSQDVRDIASGTCGLAASGQGVQAGHLPVIVFDLAGGANLLGSEALIGVSGGQQNFLSTAGYAKLGVPGNMVPTTGSNISADLGLLWHSDGAILRGIQAVSAAGTRAGVNGMVFAARSENDTGNNPHNPMYALAKVLDANNVSKLKGSLLTLIGTQSSVSGGNSAAPAAYIDPALQPTKIAQPSDATALVNGATTVDPVQVAIMESQMRISAGSSTVTNTVLSNTTLLSSTSADAALKKNVTCAYASSAFSLDSFTSTALDPTQDTNITSMLTAANLSITDADVKKTVSVMKLVLGGFAGAGTITLSGYDYHDSTRATGEQRNFKAGQMIGLVLEYAARVGAPVMVYVFSDGSLSASNQVDSSTAGRNKLAWQGDNQATAGTFLLAYSPKGRPTLRNGAAGQQIGYFSSDGSVVTTSAPSANAVTQLVEAVVLNYMGLLGMDSQFTTLFPKQGLGATLAPMTCFAPIV